MDQQELLALFDRQQRVEIEIPGMRKEILPQVVRFIRPAPGMNYIGFHRLDETNAEAAIQEQIAYFQPMGQPFGWDVYGHDAPQDMRERLIAHGYQLEDEPGTVMVLDLQPAPPALLEPVTADVRRIETQEQIEDIIQVEEAVWGGSFGWMRQRMGDHLKIPGYLSIYAAYVDDQPVCSGWTYFHPDSDFAGLFGGSTLPEFRRRGLYSAVLAKRVQEAAARGRQFMSIDASSMSRPIVAKHGFQFLTESYFYVWKG